MVVYGKPGGVSKVIKDSPETRGRRGLRLADNESVIGVLEHRTGNRGGERVTELTSGAGGTNETLEDVCNDDEKVGGEGVSLPKPVATSDPVARHPVEEHRSVPSGEDTVHPLAPPIIEATGSQDRNKAAPINGVKGFAKVDFEHKRGSFPVVTTPEDVRGIHNVLRDSATRKEARLVSINESVDGGLESSGEDFGNGFHNAVLEGDGPKERGVVRRFRFRKED
jgi:hypothetical protein